MMKVNGDEGHWLSGVTGHVKVLTKLELLSCPMNYGTHCK